MIRKYYGRGAARDIAAPPMRSPAPTHCQICERDILARNKRGLIAHHGYQRPHGEGYQTNSCFGARWQPYEESRSALPPYIEMVDSKIAYQERYVAACKEPGFTWTESYPAKHPSGELYFKSVTYAPYEKAKDTDPYIPASEHDAKYRKALELKIAGEERKLSDMRRERVRAQARYDNWKPVEVKHG